MIKSMTGFGKADCEINQKKYAIELKTLNSKTLDMNIRIPQEFNEQELRIRHILGKCLERGKVYFGITIDNASKSQRFDINKKIVLNYYNQLKEIGENIHTENSDFLSIIMRFPDTIIQKEEDSGEDEWLKMEKAINEALEKCNEHRISEGKALINDIIKHIERIEILSKEIPKFEKQRVETIKERINNNFDSLEVTVQMDPGRIEHEIFFYIEKLDITEEKVRLKKHIQYFKECIEDKESQGKKLNFISQEIGREINTIGSKANSAEIQRIVVQMKDHLERVKEQLMNIL